MMKATDIAAYNYRADLYHPRCILPALHPRYLEDTPDDVEDWLNWEAERRGIDRQDEATFDSGDFPKVVFADQVRTGDGEYDTCGRCGETILE